MPTAPTHSRAILRRYWHVGLLLLAPLLVLWRPIAFGEIFYYEDLASQYFPRERMLMRDGLSGWNPHVFLGMPLAGDPQSAAYEPVRWVARACHLSATTGLDVFIVVYLVILTIGLYAFARRMEASRGSAAFAALIATWGGLYIVRFRHPWLFPAFCLIPWLAFFCDRLLTEQRTLDALALGIVIALGALGGHPQAPYMSALCAGAYLSVGLFSRVSRGERLRAAGRISCRLAVGAAACLALVARMYLPVITAVRHSSRFQHASLGIAGDYSFNPWDWFRLLVPDVLGNDMAGTHWGSRNYHEQACYFGVAPLLLFLVAIYWRRKREPDRTLLLVTMGLFVLAAGRFGPLFYLAYWLVPGFKLFRTPTRYKIFAGVFFAVLVARVVTAMADGERPDEPGKLARWFKVGCLVGAAVLCAAFVVGWTVLDRYTGRYVHVTTCWALAKATVLLLACGWVIQRWLRGAWTGKTAFRWLAAITVLDLVVQWAPYRQTAPPAKVLPDPTVVAALDAALPQRVLIQAVKQNHQADIVPLVDWGEAAGYENLRGYNQMVGSDVTALLAKGDTGSHLCWGEPALGPTDPADWLLDLTGVRRIAAREGKWPKRWQGLPLVARGGGYEVRERSGWLPRAWLVSAAAVKPGEAALAALPALDPRRVAIVDRDVGLPAEPGGEPGTVSVTERSNDEVVLEANARTPALLVLSDHYDESWQAAVDGAPARIYRTDYLLRGVRLQPGRHRIVFRFVVPWAAFGRWILPAAVTAVALALLLAGALRRRERQGGERSVGLAQPRKIDASR